MHAQVKVVSQTAKPAKKVRPGAPERKFSNLQFWNRLAARYVPHPYRLPDWNTAAHPAALKWWAKCLQIRGYTYTDFEKLIRLRPAWPLRLWVCLMLEMKAQAQKESVEMIKAA